MVRLKNVKDENAQMTIDYVAGLGIFMLVVVFVFQFMYGLFTPFQTRSSEVVLAADRASTILMDRLMIDDMSGSMNVIDQGKLYYFNDTKLNSYGAEYKNTLREIGLISDNVIFDLNMTVTRFNGDVMNQSGPIIPENVDIGRTIHTILIVNSSTGYNETAFMSVRVW